MGRGGKDGGAGLGSLEIPGRFPVPWAASGAVEPFGSSPASTVSKRVDSCEEKRNGRENANEARSIVSTNGENERNPQQKDGEAERACVYQRSEGKKREEAARDTGRTESHPPSVVVRPDGAQDRKLPHGRGSRTCVTRDGRTDGQKNGRTDRRWRRGRRQTFGENVRFFYLFTDFRTEVITCRGPGGIAAQSHPRTTDRLTD